MLEIKLNLLGDMSVIRRQKRLKFFIISVFAAISLFSLIIIIITYQTNKFIYQVNKKEINTISQKLSALHPKLDRIIFLDQKLKKISKTQFYKQSEYRPINWYDKLKQIAIQTPDDIVLENLKVHTGKNKNRDNNIHVQGIMKLNENNPGIQELDRFKKGLEVQPYFMKSFNTIEITRSRINHRQSQPVLSFAMEIK